MAVLVILHLIGLSFALSLSSSFGSHFGRPGHATPISCLDLCITSWMPPTQPCLALVCPHSSTNMPSEVAT